MGENLRLLYDLMDYTNHKDLPGLLLLIDVGHPISSDNGLISQKLL